MASLLFRLCGRSPHNSPLVIGPRALATTLNQRGGRGRPPNPEEMLQTIGQMMAQVARRSDASTPFARCWSMYACYGCGLLHRHCGGGAADAVCVIQPPQRTTYPSGKGRLAER